MFRQEHGRKGELAKNTMALAFCISAWFGTRDVDKWSWEDCRCQITKTATFAVCNRPVGTSDLQQGTDGHPEFQTWFQDGNGQVKL